MSKKQSSKKETKLHKLKRICALAGAILLAGMYIATLVLALIGNAATQNMLMASIVCTVLVPVVLYAMILTTRVFGNSGSDSAEDQDPLVEPKDSDKS